MPEGDTIHRTAARLRPALEGRVLRRCECELAAAADWLLEGRQVARIEARGKHLLIHCAPLEPAAGRPDPRRTQQLPVVIWTHMGMTGRWQVDGPGTVAPARGRTALALHTDGYVARCSAPKTLAFLGPRGLLRNQVLARLGPDLLDPGADLDEAVARLRQLGAVELGDAIMRQSAVAGIGNVYKSELLFIERRDPFGPVGAVEPELLRALLERARALMRHNVEAGGPRRTRFGTRERLWVYERSGRPCRACAATIEMRRQGSLARSTYFCPRCQLGA